MDVSIRPGWFHHASEDGRVATVDRLLEIHEQSIGRGANLLLNIPPDRRGLIPDAERARLREFGRRVAGIDANDLARVARATADRVRGASPRFGAALVNDGDPATYWATDDGVTTGAIVLEWPAEVVIDRVVVQEAIALGQRVEAWTVDVEVDGRWRQVSAATTIGYRRLVRFPETATRRIRVAITRARACPLITAVSAHRDPA